MLQIDGSHGEGGGQILRSSLTLSLVTGRPFTIERIRAGRRKPGLMRQHRTAVLAAACVGDARVEGAEIGSTRLVFEPRKLRGGEIRHAVGTAGSTTLVLWTVLPALLLADGPSRVTVTGGTHNLASPPFDFLDRVVLPLVRRSGGGVRAELRRHGFFPAGGGEIRVEIDPGPLRGFDLLERGEVQERRARASVSHLPTNIARRELRVVREALGWSDDELEIVEVADSPGPGNVVSIEMATATCTEMTTGFGRKGVPAEAVARSAVDDARAWLAADVPVGVHLADQLLLLLAVAGGGRFRTLPLSRHSRTQIDVLRDFLGIEIRLEPIGDGRAVEVTVPRPGEATPLRCSERAVRRDRT